MPVTHGLRRLNVASVSASSCGGYWAYGMTSKENIVLGLTVVTSMDDADLVEVGIHANG